MTLTYCKVCGQLKGHYPNGSYRFCVCELIRKDGKLDLRRKKNEN